MQKKRKHPWHAIKTKISVAITLQSGYCQFSSPGVWQWYWLSLGNVVPGLKTKNIKYNEKAGRWEDFNNQMFTHRNTLWCLPEIPFSVMMRSGLTLIKCSHIWWINSSSICRMRAKSSSRVISMSVCIKEDKWDLYSTGHIWFFHKLLLILLFAAF